MTRALPPILAVLLLGCPAPDSGRTPADRTAPPRLRKPPPPPPARRAPRRAAPPRRRPPRKVISATPATTKWSRQKAAWARLLRRITPLAKRGAWLPTFKLRKHFRRQGIWALPSFNAKTLSAAERKLLSPKGAATQADVNGPAGRRLWVEGARYAQQLADILCPAVAACGLTCSPKASSLHTSTEHTTRQLARLRRDHDLVLHLVARPEAMRIRVFVPPTGQATRPLRRAVKEATRGLPGRIQYRTVPTARLGLGLMVQAHPEKLTPEKTARIADALCQLAGGPADQLMALWHGDRKASRRRAKALAQWLKLRFVQKKVPAKRPKLEHRYIRRHYRDRVFNWRRRTDGAYLIRPAMVVLHHTGGLSLRSALYTLTSLKLGSRAGLQNPKSLSVGVPYLIARNGRIYRLFKDDDRFGRHTIGLNHSAIGIENVGTKRSGFTAAQVRANARLIQYLAMRYPLRYLVGHREVYQMGRTPYYLEAVPRYCSNKNDPTRRALRTVRARTRHLALAPPPTTKPVLKNCKDMRRYFKQLRRAARRSSAAR